MSRFVPPFPPHDPTDPKGFSYMTVVKRWPIILTGIINDIISRQEALRKDTNLTPEEQDAAIREGVDIVREISRIKAEMSRDREMPKIEQDDGPVVDEFNRQLKELGEKGTWFKAPWLYAELVNSYLFHQSPTFF
ncbi:hypothetical protein FRC18_006535 [Serendipita sp. 400]|nr:hypothetical protein FRC18_006535 [Serendipita sp. 400]